MKTLSGLVLCACIGTIAGTATAGQDDNAKKLLGAWEVVKQTGDLPVGTIVEFLKEGHLKVIVKEDGNELKLEGTYKLAKAKLMVSVMVGDEKHDKELTIKKLTADTLKVENKEKKVESFVKRKEKKD